MRRKRAKLQVQNAEMGSDTVTPMVIAPTSKLFSGLSIHVGQAAFAIDCCVQCHEINGWTKPSVQELRKMIVEHGGAYHAYIDKKNLVCVLRLSSNAYFPKTIRLAHTLLLVPLPQQRSASLSI